MLAKIRELGVPLFIAKALEVSGIRLADMIKKSQYSKQKSAFKIRVDDDHFVMSFLSNKIGKAILERIEGVRETDTTSIIKSVLRPGNCVLEIGGCYGYFTMLMANAVGESGKVVSIEGLPSNFEILEYNTQYNGFKNIECFNLFVGNNDSVTKYNSVKSVNIPEFLKNINFKPTHIFMDIEGFEVEAIDQLCDGYLGEHSPMLVFEHHEFIYSSGRGLDYIREKLGRNGYEVRKVYGNVVAFKK